MDKRRLARQVCWLLLPLLLFAAFNGSAYTLELTAGTDNAPLQGEVTDLSEVSIRLQPPDVLVELCREQQKETLAEELIEKKLSDAAAEKKRKRAQPFAKGQTRRYLVCAAILLAASFLTRYALYYRLLAGVSLALAGMSFFVNRSAKQEEVRV